MWTGFGLEVLHVLVVQTHWYIRSTRIQLFTGALPNHHRRKMALSMELIEVFYCVQVKEKFDFASIIIIATVQQVLQSQEIQSSNH